MSKGHFERARSRKHGLKRCKMKENTSNVVIIDIDTDLDEVIIIDADGHESLPQKSDEPSVFRVEEKSAINNIVSIDDDNVDDDHPGVGLDTSGDLDSDASSNKKPVSASNHSRSVMDLDGDDCQFIRESIPYPGQTPHGNRYGLSADIENDFSESDFSDCEVMEGSSGKLRDQWERAYTEKKFNVRGVQSGVDDMASASGYYGEADPVIAEKNSSELCRDVSEDSYVATGVVDFGGTSLDPGLDSSFAQFNCNGNQDRFSRYTAEPSNTVANAKRDGSVRVRGVTSSECPPSAYDFYVMRPEEDINIQRPNSRLDHDSNDKNCNSGLDYQEKSQTVEEAGGFDSIPVHKIHSDCTKTKFKERELSFNCLQSETRAHRDKLVFGDKNEEFNPGHSNSVDGTLNECAGVEVKAVPSAAPFEGGVIPAAENGFCSIPLRSDFEVDNGNAICEQVDEIEGLVCARKGIVAPVMESNIINERERMKETEEYKKATEEEWSARQRQLQIQAEEAQRLRKRRRAESMRLLDMEKRQKQRLEEVRATQKQDEENLNMKEQLRVEIRKALVILETTCVDMAAVLRGLGVKVGSGIYPSPHEVQSAYKRALLKFHPDRASRNNIREQVEAEEKFKLMSLMKEKLPWSA